jgi:hypothetical protein
MNMTATENLNSAISNLSTVLRERQSHTGYANYDDGYKSALGTAADRIDNACISEFAFGDLVMQLKNLVIEFEECMSFTGDHEYDMGYENGMVLASDMTLDIVKMF